jgi:hypothetical protein
VSVWYVAPTFNCHLSPAWNATLLFGNGNRDRVHTGGVHDMEVLTEHWLNVHLLYDLPAGFMLWSEFEATCGLPGILDGDSDQSVVLLRNHHSNSEWLDVLSN